MTQHKLGKQQFPGGFTVIGTGRLGTALASRLHHKRYRVHSLFNRSEASCRKLAEETGTRLYGTFPEERNQLGDLVFLAVPDDQIAVVAKKLADRFPDLSGSAWVHTSGATPADVLRPLADCGASVAAFHPVQTFHKKNRESAFDRCFVTLQGDPDLCGELKHVVQVLGARPLVVDEQQKMAIHLAAVLVCNYYAALFFGAQKVLKEHHVEVRSRELFGPIVTQTVDALLNAPPDEVLTGPVVRGDTGSIEKHLSLLKAIPEWDQLYRSLGRETLALARKIPGRDTSADRQLELVFNG